MCGLNLIWDKKNLLQSESEIQQMNQATASRGPDESQTLILSNSFGNFFLGHNRLKIRDLSLLSAQPYRQENVKKTLLYNGELYSAQSDFNQADTIELFNILNQNLVNYSLDEIQKTTSQLNGMYAWAWLDVQQNKLLIVRDFWKIKPLYYFENEQYLIISSEIKGILASGLVSKKLNQTQIIHYLKFRFAQSPQTFFEGIYQIDSPIIWDLESAKKEEIPVQKPSLYQNTHQFTPQVLIQKTEKALKQSLNQQLVAEVPVGLFLSGGIDSTLLLTLLQEREIKNFPVFTLGDAAWQGTKDSYFAKKAAEQYGAEYQETTLSAHCLQDIPRFFTTLDQPIADPAAFLTELLSHEAKKSVKVVLSGAGADELFAGYHRHGAFQKYLRYKPLFDLFPSFLLNYFPNQFEGGEKLRQIKKFFSQLSKNPQETFINFTKLQWSLGLKNLPIEPLKVAYSEDSDFLRFALHYDQQHYLAQDVLAITDHSSMKHGLEVRVPYLDAEVWKVLEGAKASQVFGNSKKWILKEILKQKGGEIYVNRRKEGFGFPFGQWLRVSENQYFALDLLDKSSIIFQYLEYDFAEIHIKAHLLGKIDFSSEIWALWCLKTWLEFHF